MRFADIICLANSYKKRGRCIAGLHADGSGWVRLNHPETAFGELYPEHYLLPDGSEPKPFDIIRVPLAEHVPVPHHPENWTVGEEPWKLIARPADPSVVPILSNALARGPTLLGDDQARTPFDHFDDHPLQQSLALVEPRATQWMITKAELNVRKPRVLFMHGGHWYNLPLTDPLWIPRLKPLDYGKHTNNDLGIPENRRVLLSISLSEEFEDRYCYKLVTGVLQVSKQWRHAVSGTKELAGTQGRSYQNDSS
jgi:hypothetical protein